MMSSPNRLLGSIVGALFVLFGAVGFTVSVGVFDQPGELLLGVFTLNGAQNALHILIGAALLLAAVSSTRAAKKANSVIGAFCLVLGLAGLFLIGSAVNVLAINVADNVVHFAAAVVLLAAGLGAENPARTSSPS